MQHLQRISESHIGTDQVVVPSGISEYRRETDNLFHGVFKRADGLMYVNNRALKNQGTPTR